MISWLCVCLWFISTLGLYFSIWNRKLNEFRRGLYITISAIRRPNKKISWKMLKNWIIQIACRVNILCVFFQTFSVDGPVWTEIWPLWSQWPVTIISNAWNSGGSSSSWLVVLAIDRKSLFFSLEKSVSEPPEYRSRCMLCLQTLTRRRRYRWPFRSSFLCSTHSG